MATNGRSKAPQKRPDRKTEATEALERQARPGREDDGVQRSLTGKRKRDTQRELEDEGETKAFFTKSGNASRRPARKITYSRCKVVNGEEVIEQVEAVNHVWSGNWAHCDDEDVTIDGLADVTLDTESERAKNLDVLLCSLRTSEASKIADTGTYVLAKSDLNEVREDIAFHGIQVVKVKFLKIDCLHDVKPFIDCDISRRIYAAAQEKVDKRASLAVERCVMTDVLQQVLNDNTVIRGRKGELRGIIANMVHHEMWKHPEVRVKAEEDVQNKTPIDSGKQGIFDEVCDEHKRQQPDKFHIYETHNYISGSGNLLLLIEGRDVALFVDKNNELIVQEVLKADGKLTTGAALGRMNRATQAMHWRHPLQKPDPNRHSLDVEINRPAHPEHDHELEGDHRHFACISTDHIGPHTAKGNQNILYRQELSRALFRKGAAPEAPWKEFEKYQYGTLRIATELSEFGFKRGEPEL